MSWQTYIDDQLLGTKSVKHAVICGHDGSIWATSKDPQFQVTPEELKTIIANFDSVPSLASNGIRVGGKKYMYLSSDDRSVKVVRGKKDQNGVHCIKTSQTFIVCVYEDPMVPEQAAIVTEKLGDYLVGVGF